MLNRDVYLTALDRYIKATNHDSNKAIDTFDVIVFLQKEIDSYRDKIKRMDNRTNELIMERDALTQNEPAQTLAMEQAADGGIMTIKNATCYQDIVSILLSNGYFVCCHIDDENGGETITIEYWRA